MSESVNRARIVEEARRLIGVRFRHQGFDPRTGIDCRGLLLCIARAIGQELTRPYRTNYPRKPDPAEFRSALEAELLEISEEEAGEGDVLLLHAPREEGATHVGVVAEGPYERMLIHATEAKAGVVEEPLRRWRGRIRGAFRYRGLVV